MQGKTESKAMSETFAQHWTIKVDKKKLQTCRVDPAQATRRRRRPVARVLRNPCSVAPRLRLPPGTHTPPANKRLAVNLLLKHE